MFAGEISAFSPFSDPSRVVMIAAFDCKRRMPAVNMMRLIPPIVW